MFRQRLNVVTNGFQLTDITMLKAFLQNARKPQSSYKTALEDKRSSIVKKGMM